MKKIMTVLFLLLTGITGTLTAQNSWKPDPANKYNIQEITPQYLTRTETYFGADLEYTEQGATVIAVMPNSPAENYSFRKGDIITAIGGIVINSKSGYVQAMEANKPDDVVKISYIRKGVAKEKKVKLEKIQVFKQAGTI